MAAYDSSWLSPWPSGGYLTTRRKEGKVTSKPIYKIEIECLQGEIERLRAALIAIRNECGSGIISAVIRDMVDAALGKPTGRKVG